MLAGAAAAARQRPQREAGGGGSAGAGRGADAELVQYTGAIDCLRRSIRDEGPLVLFKGWGASFARLLPVLLIVFPLLERLRVAFGVGTF